MRRALAPTRVMKSGLCVAAAAAVVVVVGGVAPASAGGNHHSKAVEDLFSPLGFAIAADGTFYVAEAFTGQLTRVDRRGERTVLVDPVEGQFTAGVDVRGNRISYTLSLPPEFQEFGPPKDTLLNTIAGEGALRQSVSILDYETASNPDSGNLYGVIEPGECEDALDALSDFLGPAAYPGLVESNPYAVAYDRGGSRVVADAAGNSLLRVSKQGAVSTIAVLPPIPQTLTTDFLQGTIAQINAELPPEEEILPDALDACVGQIYQSNPVPTDVEVGPDGHYYVSALPGSPEGPGSGSVFRINRADGTVTLVADGFTGAVDLAVRGGTVFVAEIFAGQVSHFKLSDPSMVSAIPVDCPTALEVDQRGRVWVAEGGICTDGPPSPGRIVRLAG
jgi:hypothetical protein